jgi:hypothetical protein
MAQYATAGAFKGAWEHRGYSGSGNVEDLLDSLRGRSALVCGSARGVFDDFTKLYDGSQVVFAANDVGVYLPRVDHLVSLHYDKLVHWAALRADPSSKPVGNTDFKTHTAHLGKSGIDYGWQGLCPLMVLSGYFAMQVAYLMGCDRIVLVGCPGDNSRRFWETNFNNPAYTQEGVLKQLRQEMGRLPEFKATVRSASGWTREFFGGPNV